MTALVSALTLPGCIEASQEAVEYPAFAAPRGDGTATVDGWTITLSRADIALGPFYFCAASSGSATLCDSSIAELTRVVVVDALSPSPVQLGTVRGYSGAIRSASYDFGISWFDTQIEPTPAAATPGGHSVHLEGVARNGVRTVAFVADVDVVPQFAGQQAIATAPANADVTPSTARLDIALDAAAWLKNLDFSAIAATSADPRATLAIGPASTEHGALLLGIKNLAPLEFRWVGRGTQP